MITTIETLKEQARQLSQEAASFLQEHGDDIEAETHDQVLDMLEACEAFTGEEVDFPG